MEKTITITVKCLEECTEAQLEEFLRFELGDTASMKMENPLSGFDLRSACDTIYFSID